MKILVVDDDATNRMVLKGLLEQDQHEVLLAENGGLAVDLYREQSPGLVLMDIMMPVMDGYEATRIIKSESKDSFVPVIFLTALSGDDALVNCVENGGDDFLKKPFNRTILKAKISALERIQTLYNTVNAQKSELQVFRQQTISEHEVAEKIFANVMSQGDGNLPMLKAINQSADAFNGDIVLVAHNPGGGINILVGDFTGHGLAAAIGAMPVANVFYKMTGKGFSIEDILPEINRSLESTLPMGRFLAACLMHIDNECTSLTIWNGGLPDVILTHPDRAGIAERVESFHLPLGVLSPIDMDTRVRVLPIKPGMRITAYSDGIIEAENPRGEMFGIKRLEEWIVKCKNEPAGFVTHIADVISEYHEEKSQADDITLIEFECDPVMLREVTASSQAGRGKTPTTWGFSVELQPDSLQSVDPLPMLMQFLSDIQGINAQHENLFTVLSELYNNAMDHGVLGLDSELKNSGGGFASYYNERTSRLTSLKDGFIRVHFNHEPDNGAGCLTIRVQDSGKGFDFQSRLNKITGQVEKDAPSVHHGRGLPLLMALCDSIEFYDDGATIEVKMSVN